MLLPPQPGDLVLGPFPPPSFLPSQRPLPTILSPPPSTISVSLALWP